MKNYFPTVLATGSAFCNRKEELAHLSHNFEAGTPTLLASPRRYGKTSLAIRALEKAGYPFTHIDLYKALNEKEIGEYILNGIGKLLGQIEKTPKKLMRLATSFFGAFQLKFTFSDVDIAVELTRKKGNTAELILKALEHLDKLVIKHCPKKIVILFLDEFQVLSEVTNDTAIEAAIREAMQKAKAIRYLFAGSNRHLIERMFNDHSRPFFNSCDQITLERIAPKHYIRQINKAARERWQEKLSDETIESILNKSESHPYYVNKLCSILLRQKNIPSSNDVVHYWDKYKSENTSRVQQEISLLKLNQRRILINIATDYEVENPFGIEYSNKCELSPTSIHRAMAFLIEHDYIYKSNNKYKVLDPLIGAVLAE